MKKRNSNLELLRIISMFLIVMHHYSLHGLGGGLTYSLNRYLASLSILGGKLGVIIFVLISGYYMCHSEFNGRKLAKLWGQVFFYTLSIFVIFIFMEKVGAIDNFYNPTGLRDFLPILMPIGHQVYWFVTCFVILMVVSPLLNLILRTVGKNRDNHATPSKMRRLHTTEPTSFMPAARHLLAVSEVLIFARYFLF